MSKINQINKIERRPIEETLSSRPEPKVTLKLFKIEKKRENNNIVANIVVVSITIKYKLY